MPWTDEPGPRPQRSPDELLAVVQRRAAVLRRRRRAGASAGLGGVVVALLAATALVGAGDDPTSELRVVGQATTSSFVTTTTTTVPATPAPPATTIPPTPTPSPPNVRATGPVPDARTSPTRAPTTTTSRPATSTTTAPATTTTEPPPLPVCDASDVVVTATLDRPSYPVGSPMRIDVAAQNRSSRACQPADPRIEFRNSAGVMQGGAAVVDRFTMSEPGGPRPSWDPGETLSYTFDGGSVSCFPDACPPGSYTVVASFGPFRAPPTPFTLT